MKSKKHICPSAPLYEGSMLLGIVNERNEVSILAEPMKIDGTFVESAKKGRVPEQRFRFANKCLKSGCGQWTGTECGVIKRVLHGIDQALLKDELPECSIRTDCRWYDQEGSDACRACPLIRFV